MRSPRSEGPDFVALNLGRLHAANLLIVEGVADVAGVDPRLRDGVYRNVNHAGDRPQGRALNQHVEDLDAFGERKLVHEIE
jgi:hypothetical protein